MPRNGLVTLPEQSRRLLLRLVEDDSCESIARGLRVSAATLARACAGLPILQLTAAHLEQQLR